MNEVHTRNRFRDLPRSHVREGQYILLGGTAMNEVHTWNRSDDLPRSLMRGGDTY